MIDSTKIDTPLEISDIYNYAAQIARAIQAAHKKNIVHRDIKSSNIMLTPSSQIKVMDFGLAKMGKEDKSDFSKSTIGTAAYMSPEQAMGSDVDHRSDIWSFGVVLYEMICSELPFQGDYEQAILFSIQNEDPIPLKEKREDIPEILDNIVSKCLKRDPDKRYQEMLEILEDLDDLKEIFQPTIPSPKAEKASKLPGKRLAVLPISNISPSPDDEYFAVGMTEELISTLSKIKDLRIIARASVMKYKTISQSINEIGRELNVGTVLQGSIRKSTSQIRVSVQLVDTNSEDILWSHEYNKGMLEVFEIQSDIAKSVANALKIKLLKLDKEKVEEASTNNNDAYQLYLKGRFFWNKRTKEDVETSIEFLEKATNTDPEFAIAYAALADAYIISNDYNYMPPDEAFAKALHGVQKAMELDNELAQAHSSYARINAVYNWGF